MAIPVGKKLLKVTIAEFDAGNPVCYIGGFGIGKTSMAFEIARWYEENRGIKMKVVNWKGSKYTPEQVSGLMFIDKETQTTRFFPHEFLKTDQPILLMLDEITNAPFRTVAAFAEVLTERRFGEVYLPEGSQILAAGNPPTESQVASQLLEILRTRMTVLEVTASKDDFLSYGLKNNIDPLILSFINYNPEELYSFRPDETNMPCPRNWERLSKSITSFKQHKIDLIKALVDPSDDYNNVARDIVVGKVGETTANKLVAHAKIVESMNLDKIVNKDKKELKKLRNAEESVQFFVMMCLISMFAADTIDEETFTELFREFSNPIQSAALVQLRESGIILQKGIAEKINDMVVLKDDSAFFRMLKENEQLLNILIKYGI